MHQESHSIPGSTEAAARTSEIRYRQLFESAKDGFLIIDANTSQICDVNPFLVELLGYSRSDLVGRKLSEINFFDDPGASHEILQELHEKHYLRHEQLPLRARNGRRVDVELISNLYHDGTQSVIQCDIRDISDRKRADDLLLGQNRVLEMLATGAELDDILEALIRVIEEQSEGIFGSILITRQGSHHFYTGVAPSLPPAYLDALKEAPITPPYLGPCSMTAHRGETAISNRIGTDPRWSSEWRELILGFGLNSCYSSPIFASDGRILGSFGIYQHATNYTQSPCPRLLETATHLAGIAIERKQVETALHESDRRKDAFLATLSHELRNPLASIRNAVQLLQHSIPDDHPAARPTAVLDRQVTQMVRLVDDLLEISRINRAKVKLNLERVELSAIIQQAVDATSTLVQCMHHKLQVVLPPEPVYLRADPCRLSQVLANLLDNACKYTGDGGHIFLSAESCADEVIIRVRDTGVGIDKDQFQFIFEMFTQIDASLARAQSGLGIGLTLVKSLVQLHGGTVEVQSAGRNQGTEFTVRLSLTVDAESTLAKPSSAVATEAHRILIVDDDPDAADTLSMLLELSGHQTRTLNESTEAVATAESFAPDLVLLDIGMPKMDGYSVARSIRQQPWGNKPVLVALTGWGQEEDRRKSREAGFDGHLVKPADYVTLSHLIADLDRQHHGSSLN